MRSLLKALIIVMGALVLLFAGVATAQTEPDDDGNAWSFEGPCEEFGGIWLDEPTTDEPDQCAGVDVPKEICEGIGSVWQDGMCTGPETVSEAAPASPTPAAPTYTG